MLVDDTSTAWADPRAGHPRPSSTGATRWSSRPPRPAPPCTVVFQRDVQPTGADYSGSVTVPGPGGEVPGTVAETAPGTLLWTPAAALAPGVYTLTVRR